VRVDYAYGFHPYLPNDSRFFLTVQMGKKKGARYFRDSYVVMDAGDAERKKNLLRILSEYPNAFVVEAVNELAEVEDTTRSQRYYNLTGGLGRAQWLFQEAKALLKRGKLAAAQRKAMEAAREYAPIFVQPEHLLGDRDLMDYGEALIIAGRIEEAHSVLIEVEESTLRSYFLTATCHKALTNWDEAIEAFRHAVRRYQEEQDYQSMVSLSFLGLGETLLRKEQYESAYTTLDVLLNNYTDPLDPDYPRYPIFQDDYIVDDARYLGGVAKLLSTHSTESIGSIMETIRYYPDLDYGRLVEEESNALIDLLRASDYDRLEGLAQRLLTQYYQAHRWPVEE
jgi:tetratricopeptide (TPR) repeat protein